MLRIIIADDEFDIVELCRALITYPGAEIVGEACNGIELLKKIEELHPDVVITDICMPGMTGLELIERAKQEFPAINFIVMSGYTEFQYAQTALRFGVWDYLLKPLDPARLQRTLDRLVQLARRENPVADGQGATAPGSGDPGLVAAPLRTIPCIGHNRILLLPLAEVEYVFSDLAGNHVVTASREGTTELTLRTLEARSGLLRCHRQYLLNPAQIAEILLLDGGLAEVVTRSGRKVPVSRRFLRPLKEQLAIP